MSTSSSDWRRRLPIAGSLAVALLLTVDALVFRVFSPWGVIKSNTDHWLYNVLIRDRIVVDSFARHRRGKPNALLMGTSRLAQAWEPKRIDPPVPDSIRILSIKHTGVFPPVIRASAEAMSEHPPDVVVLGISEVDTHAPLEMNYRTAFPNVKLYLEAARHLGVGWLFSERQGLYRYALGDVLSGYSHRKIVGSMAFDHLRRFRTPRREAAVGFPASAVEAQIAAELDAAGTYDPDKTELTRALRFEIEGLSGLRSGPHTQAQMDFVRTAVAIFREAGSEVILFELPVSPAARSLYDYPGLRAQFLEMAADLERDFDVRVIRLEAHRDFEIRDFTDLTHLGPARATEITEAILEAILDALP